MDKLVDFICFLIAVIVMIGAMFLVALSFWPVWISLAAIVYIFSE